MDKPPNIISLDYFDKINKNYNKNVGNNFDLPGLPDKKKFQAFRSKPKREYYDVDITELIPEEYSNMNTYDIYTHLVDRLEKGERFDKNTIKLFLHMGKSNIFLSNYNIYIHYNKLHKYCNNIWYCPNLRFVNHLDYDKNKVYLERYKGFKKTWYIEDKYDNINIHIQYILFNLHLITYLRLKPRRIDRIVKFDNYICIPYYINGFVINLKTNYLIKFDSKYDRNTRRLEKLKSNEYTNIEDIFNSFKKTEFNNKYVIGNKTIKEFVEKLLESEFIYEIECDKIYRLNVV
uniref:Uncharacterized protein n=1 Tax=Pithovirus LCDPAC02 TaxID=2506601 RepID=A0A481YRC9_9VIRU|nr:MAG: hypothetical protein LCDPAC02_02230 [Pithovirus LCDPAC02]